MRHSDFWWSIYWGDNSPELVITCHPFSWQRRSWLYMDSMILVWFLSWGVLLWICALPQFLFGWGGAAFLGAFLVLLGLVLWHDPILCVGGVIGISPHQTPFYACYIQLGSQLQWCFSHPVGWRWLFQCIFCWLQVFMVFCGFLGWIWLFLHLELGELWGVECGQSILFSNRSLVEWLQTKGILVLLCVRLGLIGRTLG